MKFPGKRKTKHYFPVTEDKRVAFSSEHSDHATVYATGIDQLIVDIEANVDEEFLGRFNIMKGESIVLDDEKVDEIYQELKARKLIVGEFAGGAIGNTLHNFSVLSDSRSVLLGVITEMISVGDYAFNYICTTNSFVDFSFLKPVDGPMGKALCLLTPDKERSFVIGKGIMDELCEDFIPEEVLKTSSTLLITAYCLRDENSKMFKATQKACEIALMNNVPVVLSLGTSSLIESKKDFFTEFIRKYVSIVAMNEMEAQALVDETDPLLACEKVLDLCDFTLLTVGPSGLYIGAHVDEAHKRMTKDRVVSKSIAEYNLYEYSRAMLKKDCQHPIKIYTHINPFMGGPEVLKNTNGAGDAALSAILHDIASNTYHRKSSPASVKHNASYLTYSSIHQVSKYCNRVSYEILRLNSPRLLKGLPDKEESLEDAYWEK